MKNINNQETILDKLKSNKLKTNNNLFNKIENQENLINELKVELTE